MTFTSLAFVPLLGAALLARVTIGRDGRGPLYVAALLVLSLVFYAWQVPAYVALVLVTAAVHFAAGASISSRRLSRRARTLVLAGAVTASLALLATFKYANFAIDVVGSIGSVFTHLSWQHLGLVLPIGISFYTFHALSYSIDLKRGRTQPARSFPQFLLYITFFPQLVAGPITRASEFLYQFERRRRLSNVVAAEAAYLIIRGFFFKLVIADNIAWVVDRYWSTAAAPGASSSIAALVVALFSMQIYADFSAYTDIARGIAYLLGFRLPINFAAPYCAASFSEFWRRWHISLSRWLRDYLYIPLGGNRISGVRTYANLFIVMLLGGLWHGAALTFVVWGAIHGGALAVERLIRMNDPRGAAPRFVWWVVVELVILVAWIFFRAANLDEAWSVTQNLFAFRLTGPLPPDATPGLLAAGVVIWVHVYAFAREHGRVSVPGPRLLGAAAACMCYLCLTCYGRNFNPFIYFKF